VAEDDATARRIAFETWPTSALEGEIGQELATPEHYEQAAALVTEEHVAEGVLCSNDAGKHLDAIAEYADAGFDHVIVQQCGDDQERLIALYADEVLPQIRAPSSRPPA
jgi:coenzyme F420-dependent glucose-6-phosphate dehydrogenase